MPAAAHCPARTVSRIRRRLRDRSRAGSRAATTAMLLAAALLLAPGAGARTIDFDSAFDESGTVVSDQIPGVTIDALNPNRSFDYAVVFDTTDTGTRDPDLEASPNGPDFWSAGNLADTELGLILILQENDTGCATGLCTQPDDEGRRPAGELGFSLAVPALDFGFDLIDVESTTAENAFIELIQNGVGSETVSLMAFLDAGSDRYDPTIELGDNSANRFAAITAASVGLEQFDRVVIHLGGSGGIDNIQATLVPEPSTALLVGGGLLVLASRRRRSA